MRSWSMLILMPLLLWTAATALTQVQPGERAVVRRWGRLLDEKPGAGLFFGLPWGLDQVQRVSVAEERSVEVGLAERPDGEDGAAPPGQFLTGDHNLANVLVVVHYRVRVDEVHKFAFQAGLANALVARTTEGVLAEWVAARKIDDVLLNATARLPAALTEQVQTRLEPYGLGVQLERANVTKALPPEEVKAAFDKVAQAAAGKVTQVNEAHQLARRQESEAAAKKFDLERRTASYAQEQRLLARADAVSFLERLGQYRKLQNADPHYLNTLWLDDMTRLYARMKEAGRIDLLDHFLSSEGLTISQFPLLPKKK